LAKLLIGLLIAGLMVAGGRYAMSHRDPSRPYTATINYVGVEARPDGTRHYFLNVGDDFQQVEVSRDEATRVRMGAPWVVK
jgi:hypothetical protein